MQFVLACDTARQLTPTHDEYWHLPIGLWIWKTCQFDCDVINPPVLRLWAALPLALGGATLAPDSSHPASGLVADLFWMSNPEHRMLWFTLGRVMIALLNGATGWLLALWARRWFGDVVSLAAAILWCCCPNILAHGSLVTHDVAAAFGFVSTLFATSCWCEQPSWKRASIVGACLGFSMLLKVTCLILFPLVIVVWFLIPSQVVETSHPKWNWKTWLGQLAVIYGLAIVVINAGYLGQQTCLPLRSISVSSQRFLQLQQMRWLSSIPIPVPAYVVQAFDRVAQDLQNPHTVFLDGEWDTRGFRTYYLKTLVYKLPLGTWLMLCLTAVQFWPKRTPAASIDAGQRSLWWRRQLALVIPIMMLIVPASMGSNQFGIRYILPVLPLLYLFASQAALCLSERRWRWKQWLVLVALLSLPLSLRYHPHHLAYFNEWAGGPDEGRNLLVDSNLDWGQDLHGLARYLREHKIDKIGLAYFGTVHPESIGIQFELLPKKLPTPGDYAISANFLMGRPFLIRTPTANGQGPNPVTELPGELSGVVSTHDDEFGYFRFFEPRARIGHSIYVYQLTEEDVAKYRQALRRAMNM